MHLQIHPVPESPRNCWDPTLEMAYRVKTPSCFWMKNANILKGICHPATAPFRVSDTDRRSLFGAKIPRHPKLDPFQKVFWKHPGSLTWKPQPICLEGFEKWWDLLDKCRVSRIFRLLRKSSNKFTPPKISPAPLASNFRRNLTRWWHLTGPFKEPLPMHQRSNQLARHRAKTVGQSSKVWLPTHQQNAIGSWGIEASQLSM